MNEPYITGILIKTDY